MARILTRLMSVVVALVAGLSLAACVETADQSRIRTTDNNGPDRAQVAVSRYREPIGRMFARKGVDFSQPIFMRAFKDENVIELWAKSQRGQGYKLVKKYDVCEYSGGLGPKTRQGDMQTPEGFYQVFSHGLKPRSQFHLSFDLGYPNPHDRIRGWTGSDLVVHGDCTSEGCFAMRDDPMEELYTLAVMNFEAGHRQFDFHSFPFRMTARRLNAEKGSAWYDFWASLQPGYEIFEKRKLVPRIDAPAGRYVAYDPSEAVGVPTAQN